MAYGRKLAKPKTRGLQLLHRQVLQRRVTSACCGLTPRSSGAPTAGHQGPVGGTRYICANRALASYRRRPLNSNVRRRMSNRSAASAFSGNAPRAQRGTSVFLASERRRRVQAQQVVTKRSIGKVHPHGERGSRSPQAAARLRQAAPLAHWPDCSEPPAAPARLKVGVQAEAPCNA